jgi:alkylation response protein AidB-like acyl-CoA dehydrogenase
MTDRQFDEPTLTDHEWTFVDRAREFAVEIIEPQAQTWERSRTFPRAAFREAASRGLAGLIVPRNLGGAGLSIPAMVRVMEILAAADFAFAFSLIVHNNLAANIARNGGEKQIATFLAPMLSGEKVGAFLLTEPNAGSDAAAIRSRAVNRSAGWLLSGEKAWVSNATAADVLSVYANIDPERGWRGIACFLIDAGRSGVTRGEPYELLGGHALGVGAFDFHEVAIATDEQLLPPERAFKEAMAGIDLARASVAAMCCGMLGNALGVAVEYTKTREVFGQKTAEFQGLQWLLADAATDLAAARALAYQAASALDSGVPATVLSAHAKKFASRVALQRVGDCMQAMGAAGYRANRPLARHLACAKMAQYLDGTSEIQNVVISRELFRGRRATD